VETETPSPKTERWYHGYRADGYEPLTDKDREFLVTESAKLKQRVSLSWSGFFVTPFLAAAGAFYVYSDPQPVSGLVAAILLMTVPVAFLSARDQRRQLGESTEDLAEARKERFVLVDLDDEPFEPSPDVLRVYACSRRILPGQTSDSTAIRLVTQELGLVPDKSELPQRTLTEGERTELASQAKRFHNRDALKVIWLVAVVILVICDFLAQGSGLWNVAIVVALAPLLLLINESRSAAKQHRKDIRKAITAEQVNGTEVNGKWIERIDSTELVWTINHLPAPWRRSSLKH